MRFLDLQLRAYGPFSNRTLNLSKGNYGLHLVYGANEAGKSSALRALRALLYGIPGQTSDNFVHDYKKLRIGARLQHSDGSILEVLRRKANKQDLIGFDENPVESSILDRYLNRVDESTFNRLFGLNYTDLIDGAQEMLAGKGSVGESIFSAGMGGSGLRELLESLENEADEIFKPGGRGSKYLILRAVAEYTESVKQMRSTALSSHTWLEHEKILKSARSERENVLADLRAKQAEKGSIERLQRALPRVARRDQLVGNLSDLGEVVRLPSDFSDKRRDTQRRLNDASLGLGDATKALTSLEEQIRGLEIPEQVVSSADDIERLFQRLGSVRKGSDDRRIHDGKRQQLRNEARSILHSELKMEVAIEDAETLRPSIAFKTRLQELGNQHQALDTEVRRSASEVHDSQESIEDSERVLRGLKSSRDPIGLRRVVNDARKQGDVEKTLKRLRATLKEKETQAGIELRRLGMWEGTLEALETLAVPSEETIVRFEEMRERDVRKLEAHAGRVREVTQELMKVNEKLQEHRLAGEVPSEDDLVITRLHRDGTWSFIRREYIDGASTSPKIQSTTDGLLITPAGTNPPEVPDAAGLPEQFEKQMGRADEVADRLRREADRVATFAQLQSQRQERDSLLEDLKAEGERLTADSTRFSVEWTTTWAPTGITPLTPREMQAWVRRQQKLIQQASEVRAARAEIADLEEIAGIHREALAVALLHLEKSAPDGGLDVILEHAAAIVEEIEKTETRRAALTEQLEKDRARLARARKTAADAQAARENWLIAWTEQASRLQLAADTSPATANAVLTRLEEVFKKIDDAEALARRIYGITKDAERFEGEVKPLVERVSPDLIEQTPEKAVDLLHSRLILARKDDATLKQLEKQCVEKRKLRDEHRANQERMTAHLETLCRQANCEDPGQLEALEERSARHGALKTELGELERLLLEEGQGLSLDQLVKETAGMDGSSLPGQLAELANEVQQLEARRTEIERTIGSEENEFKRMDGTSKSLEAAQVAQSKLAELREGVERYLKLKVASEVLRREIEQYRAQNQGPLLARAGELFAGLTLGSFNGLQIGYTDKDEPVLLGVRPNRDTLDVEGMSEGARDQLFLALRLASIERYLEQNEPMPFIVDDILIQFDDQRSEAALQALASLSKKTQVLFFTHHHRIVELAEKAVPDVLQTHVLG